MDKQPCAPMIGADVEQFLVLRPPPAVPGTPEYAEQLAGRRKKREIVPCVGIIPGTKENPHTFEYYEEGYAVQEDNVMVEWNIPPATHWDAFAESVEQVQVLVDEYLGEVDPLYCIDYRTHWHEFKPKDLLSPQAQTIGCEPDYDAYLGGKMRIAPNMAANNIRTCGGHIHLGGDFQCPDFVAALFAELFIGLAGDTVYPDRDDPRQQWYGQPGVFRPKPYGIEYRTPNNRWAFDRADVELAGSYALMCAKYLTDTDPLELQAAFRQFPWVKLREYFLGMSPDMNKSALLRRARELGVDL